jgi:hypothetical protein
MSKTRKLAAVPATVDPTLPTAIVPTAEGDIKLCLDCGALIDAEESLIAMGHKDVDLLVALHAERASSVRMFFIIASRRFHPELSPEHARDLVTLSNLNLISEAIAKVWILSMPEPKKSEGTPGPTPPVE